MGSRYWHFGNIPGIFNIDDAQLPFGKAMYVYILQISYGKDSTSLSCYPQWVGHSLTHRSCLRNADEPLKNEWLKEMEY